ncbi:bifunctional DNA-formamidopyrimidine glycosylase/DNA-(apurinic or apyrimidinic site) lyase, partial [Candidatus Saccharibacteria bacterium]|nr:bifunctional DNA-formamidopyrimidine glycosylase/DNA-(apurinic or apyrimidinic site) lyase [Candidatus Saccharibacteria bacterium]
YMPELPEVETVKRGLEKLLIGHTFKRVTSDNPKSFPNAPADVDQFLIGAAVTNIRRRAKVLLIDLSSAYTLVIHLKMTGQIVYRGEDNFGAGHPNDSLIGELPDRSTHVEVWLNNKAKLYFNDQRKFGWVRLIPTVEVPNIDFMKKVGPEPLEDSFTAKDFVQRLQRRKGSTIKAAILDQTVLAGIGNIYADEGLWGAKIHPAARVRDVPLAKLKKLFSELQYVLRLSIEKGGSTDRNYVDAEGKRGSYIDFARVFRKEGMPCQRHPNQLIEKIRVASRGTHICPKCQVLK